ncbi:MAG TPA: divalent-cation tolerance protein CutA [Thermoprotei archaeon]|nr:divalent-cation tolerance protein CutA [Thermoprotei archaeon]
MIGLNIVVFVTTSSKEEASKIAHYLVEKGLAACVNIVENISSIYVWKEKIEESKEYLLVIKTRIDYFEKLIKAIKEKHSYEIPEIIALPIIAGNKEYIKWLNKSLH